MGQDRKTLQVALGWLKGWPPGLKKTGRVEKTVDKLSEAE